MNKQLVISLVAMGVWACTQPNAWTAEPPKANPPKPDPTTTLNASINARLLSGDPQKIEEAVAAIRQFYTNNRVDGAKFMIQSWLNGLIVAHRYDDAAALALNVALDQATKEPPDFINLTKMETALAIRVHALIKGGNADEALQAAKSMYNACSMQGTGRAVDAVSDALAFAHKDDPGIAKKFWLQQLAAVGTNSAPPTSDVGVKEPSLLGGIKVNPKPYEGAIRNESQRDISLDTLVVLGNLSLLADQPQKAEDLFQMANEQWPGVMPAEGIARSIRAQDGTVRRANAWVVAQRTKAK